MKRILLSLIAIAISTSCFAQLDSAMAPFYHGVASGDAMDDRVIIWTRVTPDSGTYTYSVDWEVASDNAFSNVVNSGTATADSAADYTVKVDVTNLIADSWYYYRFKQGGNTSIVGRTRTMPTGMADELRFAVASCSNLNNGQFYHSYDHMSQQQELDAVLHLGDYIYEYNGGISGSGIDIKPDHEIVTLSDYRARYASYRLDSNLRKAHQQLPWYTVWDDHESANNSYTDGAENHTPGTEGNWQDRKTAAGKTYFEWMPIRNNPTSTDYSIYRSISLGSLGTIILLDTRLEERSEQVGTTSSEIDDPNRTILGAAQKQWFKDQLSSPNGKWKIVAQQVMFAPLEIFGGAIVNADQWDGYRADRNEVIDHVMDNDINNVVILTGDIHTSWANDVPIPGANYDPQTGAGSAFVEFVVSGITSGVENIPVGTSIIQTLNPHMKYIDLSQRGYLVLTISDEKTSSEWMHVSGVDQPTYTPVEAEHWMVLDGERFLRPYSDVGIKPYASYAHSGWLSSVYPNPADDQLRVNFNYDGSKPLQVGIHEINGKLIMEKTVTKSTTSVEFDLSSLAAGSYFVKLTDGKRFDGKVIVKK